MVRRTLLTVGLVLSVLGCTGLSSAQPGPTGGAVSVLVSGGSMMNGNHFADSTLAVMREHFSGCRKVVLVLHATFPADRDAMEVRLREAFAHIGVPAVESLHRRNAAGALQLLREAEAVFIGGGETFVLLGELYRTGQLEVLRQRVRQGVRYGGVSAGANVAGLLIGTTNDFPTAEIPSRTALGFLPVVINPHHPTPETKADYEARAGKIRGYLRFNPTETVLGIGNASIVRLHGGEARLATGRAWIYQPGSSRELKVGELIPELAATVGPK